MSIRVMTAIWDCKAYEGGTLLVLLAMADWADDTGGKIYPKLETLADKARLSIRQTQYCLGRLKEDGSIEQVAPSRRGKGAEYKIVLNRVQELHRNKCTAISSGEADRAEGVQSATVGVQSATSHIDKPSEEPSAIHQTRARDGWPEVWKAFKAWPGLSPQASEHRAREAWKRLLPELPADLVGRISAFGVALCRENDARGGAGRALVVHPHNWLERDKGWRDIAASASNVKPVDAAALATAWNGEAAKLIHALGDRGAEKFAAVFANAHFEPGPPARLCVAKQFQKGLIERSYGGPLRRAYGEVQVEVAA